MSSIKTILIPYKASDINSYVLEISYKSIRFYTQQGVYEKDGEIYSISSPYKYNELFNEKGLSRINYTQNADILYLFHPNHKIKKVYRDKNNEWHIDDFEFIDGPWQAVNTTSARLSVVENEGSRIVSSIDVFKKGDVGKLIRLTIIDTKASHWVNNHQYYEGDYVVSDGNYYRCSAAGISGDSKPTHVMGMQSDGNVMWEYKHSGYGIAEILDFVDPKEIKVKLKGEFPEEFNRDSENYNGTNYFELSVFGGDCVYPKTGTFYRGRLALFADTNNIPTVYFSCSDDFENFSDKEFSEVLDTNAITVPLYSNGYAVATFLEGGNVLYAGTSEGEFYIDSASSSNPLSPSNVMYKQFSSFGSLSLPALKVGASLFYVSKQGVNLRNILYSFEKDGYESLDVSLFGKHLLYSGVKKIVYQELPYKIIWIATQSGDLVGLTYMAEQQVLAYHRHNISGEVVDLAVIPNPHNNYEDLWLEVKRGDDYCIEWMDIGFSLDEKNYHFVDSGLSIKRTFEESFNETIRETTGALKDKQITVATQGGFRDVYEPNGEDVREIIVHGEKQGSASAYCYVQWLVNSGDKLDYKFEIPENMIGFHIDVNHFYTESGSRKVKQLFIGEYNSNLLSFNTEILGTNDSIQITFRQVVSKDKVLLSGLDHLEGKEVKIMVNGAELKNQTVNEGCITVPYYAQDITVGLPIESVYIPQTMYISGNNGTGIGDVQRIDHITLMLYKSGGGKVGTEVDDLQDIYFRENDAIMDEETPLFSGNKTILVNSRYSTIEEKGAKIVIHNSSIYPMNILAISPKLSTSGNGL